MIFGTWIPCRSLRKPIDLDDDSSHIKEWAGLIAIFQEMACEHDISISVSPFGLTFGTVVLHGSLRKPIDYRTYTTHINEWAGLGVKLFFVNY